MLKPVVCGVGLMLVVSPALGQGGQRADVPPKKSGGAYEPIIQPGDFVDTVNHKYFRLQPGTTYRYQQKTEDGLKRVEIEVTSETKEVMGVRTTVVRDRVWTNDRLEEDARDWYAQDKEGNVWYFGESVDNYREGKLSDHKGSWEAGVDGAKPGLVIRNEPKPGDTYRKEYYRGKAEDMGTVVALGRRVSVPYGTFEDCVQIRDWSRIKADENDYNFYCSGVGFLVLTEQGKASARLELVDVTAK